MAIGQDFYGDSAYRDLENLSRLQSGQAYGYGVDAARYADPWMEERKKYIPELRNLVLNPGQIESSPFYKYLQETQMNQVKASNAARGLRNSGRGLMALQDRAAGVATSAYPMLFDQYALLSGLKQSSPAAAGLSYARGTERSQDYSQMAAAARGAGRGSLSSNQQTAPTTPWWMQPQYQAPSPASGGNSYSAALPYTYDTYTPSSGAGTGYVFSDYGATSFDPKGNVYEEYLPMDEYEYGEY